MAASMAKIITVRFEQAETDSKIVVWFGTKEIQKTIPDGHGVSRIGVILNDKGEMCDIELVTEKN